MFSSQLFLLGHRGSFPLDEELLGAPERRQDPRPVPGQLLSSLGQDRRSAPNPEFLRSHLQQRRQVTAWLTGGVIGGEVEVEGYALGRSHFAGTCL